MKKHKKVSLKGKKLSRSEMKKTVGGSKYPDYWVCGGPDGFFCYEGALECETLCNGGCFQYAGCI